MTRLTAKHEGLPFFVVGGACIIAGGLVAAATAPTPTEHGTWAAAYLVLVAGVAQVGIGLGQVTFAPATPTPVVAMHVAGWNLGNAAVLVGTLIGVTPVVDLGGLLLVVTLALLAYGLRTAKTQQTDGVHRSGLLGYRLLLLILLVSIPIGLALART